MNPTNRAEAALDRLLTKHGVNLIASVCINPETSKPISRQSVEKWKVVPLIHAKTVAELDGTVWEKIRPDVWEWLK